MAVAGSEPPPTSDRSGREAGHAGGQEPRTCDPNRGAGPIQIGRDASEMERPTRTKQHAQVDVLWLRHNSLIQHQPDFLGQCIKGSLAYGVTG